MNAKDHTNSVEGTQTQHTKLSCFQKDREIENDFNTNRSVVPVENFMVLTRLDNSYSLVLLVAFWAHKSLSTLLSW